MKNKNRKLLYSFIGASLIVILAISCKKETVSTPNKSTNLPVLTTIATSNVTQNSAISGGNITSDGGSAITVKGICYSITATPTIADSKTTDGTGTGAYSSSITGLTSNTTYYARSYATNSNGTGYGSAIIFKTLTSEVTSTVTDADGNVYSTVKIGSQTWLVENLKTTKYRNGDLIGTTTLNISTETTPKYQWIYGDASVYGLLYTWDAIMDSRNICPVGWHIPTNEEWDLLGAETMYSASVLKETGNIHWVTNSGSNTTGFTALPNGYRNGGGSCYLLGAGAYWWSSTEAPTTGSAWTRLMNNTDNSFYKMANYKCAGLGVRCVKD